METYTFTATIDGLTVFDAGGLTAHAGMDGAWAAINRALATRGSEVYPLPIEIDRDGEVVESCEVEYNFDFKKWETKNGD